MRVLFFYFIFICLSLNCFGQFKYEKNNNGDPLTEITDFSQMKQGDWKYFDSNNYHFRTEHYKDHILISNTYRSKAGAINVMAYKQKNIATFSQKEMKDLSKQLAQSGNGEIIITDKNEVFIHFYYDRVKSTPAVNSYPIETLKKHSLQNTIIFF